MIGPKLGTAKGWKGNAACNDYEHLGRACVEFPAFDKLLKLLSLDFLICKMGLIIIIYPMVAVGIYSVIKLVPFFFFFFKLFFFYLFIILGGGCVGSSFLCKGFL